MTLDDRLRRHYRTRKGFHYLAFYKPFQVMCQFSREEGSEKQTLADFGFPPNVYPVGRLDYDSEGLLILSDDGRMNEELLSPRKGHGRTYLAQIENIPSDEKLDELASGVIIEGERTKPADVFLLSSEPYLPPRVPPIRVRKDIPTAWLELTLTEGRNRQVRKMTAAIGHPTLRLVRVAIGAFSLEDTQLEPGEWAELRESQIQKLFL